MQRLDSASRDLLIAVAPNLVLGASALVIAFLATQAGREGLIAAVDAAKSGSITLADALRQQAAKRNDQLRDLAERSRANINVAATGGAGGTATGSGTRPDPAAVTYTADMVRRTEGDIKRHYLNGANDVVQFDAAGIARALNDPSAPTNVSGVGFWMRDRAATRALVDVRRDGSTAPSYASDRTVNPAPSPVPAPDPEPSLEDKLRSAAKVLGVPYDRIKALYDGGCIRLVKTGNVWVPVPTGSFCAEKMGELVGTVGLNTGWGIWQVAVAAAGFVDEVSVGLAKASIQFVGNRMNIDPPTIELGKEVLISGILAKGKQQLKLIRDAAISTSTRYFSGGTV